MRETRISQLLEEISREIEVTEKRNRELYASAVDIEDEEISLRTQAESFRTLRRMRGLKNALINFRTELEKSGIISFDMPEAASRFVPEPVSEEIPERVVSIIGELGRTIGEINAPEPAAPAFVRAEMPFAKAREYTVSMENEEEDDFSDFDEFEKTQFPEEPEEPEEPEIPEESEEPEIPEEPEEPETPEEPEEPEIPEEPEEPEIPEEPEEPEIPEEPEEPEIPEEPEEPETPEEPEEPETPEEPEEPEIPEEPEEPEIPEEPEKKEKRESPREPYFLKPESVFSPIYAVKPETAEPVRDGAAFYAPPEQEVEIPVFEEETQIFEEEIAAGGISAESGEAEGVPFVSEEEDIISGIEFSYDNAFYGAPIGVDGKEGVPSIFEENLFVNDEDIVYGNDIESVSESEYEEAGIAADGSLPAVGFGVAAPEEFAAFAADAPVFAAPETEEPEISIEALDGFGDADIADDGYGDAQEAFGEDFNFSMPDVGIYTNRHPSGFTMFGKRTDVRDWQDMLVKICEILILKSPYVVAQFDKYQDLNPAKQMYFSYSETDIKLMGRRLSNGLWVEVSRTPDDIVMLCKKLLELCGYPRNELEIEFRD
ncbi:MAG: hypothetical protein LBI36_04575 [Oscillospiraceae bacterium]|jgi:hypothetical protein|nr:hypothetical protein [Oscillospiraceae bacterium]